MKQPTVLDQAISFFETQVATHGLPKTVRITFYDSFTDWQCPSEGPSTQIGFRRAQADNKRFARYVHQRGVQVIGIRFHAAKYSAWLGKRHDTRDLRAQWGAAQKVLSVSCKLSSGAIAWAVLES